MKPEESNEVANGTAASNDTLQTVLDSVATLPWKDSTKELVAAMIKEINTTIDSVGTRTHGPNGTGVTKPKPDK